MKQLLLDTHGELIVDLFAGGGGASAGIESATGRMVDIAINHDARAVAMHQQNHPTTLHYCSDVFEVCPKEATKGRPVGLLWASPDCTYHSKARGGKPIREAGKKRRALAWVVTRWAGQVMPSVIILENVEEFVNWGPVRRGRPRKSKRGKTFKTFVNSLRRLGYEVEHRELRACDFGAPTIRKRLILIARCDGQSIVWPEPTHTTPDLAQKLKLTPFRTVAECIDWSVPMCSIFATSEEAKAWAKQNGLKNSPNRPLKPASMARIARGVQKFVLNGSPFIVNIANQSRGRWGDGTKSAKDPLSTIVTKAEHALVAPIAINTANSKTTGRGPNVWDIQEPSRTITTTGGTAIAAAHLSTYYGDKPGANVRGQEMTEPVATQTTENRHALVAAFLSQNNGGFYDGPGRSIGEPISTILSNGSGHQPLVAAHIQRDFGTSTGHRADQPVGTLTTEGGGKAALVASFLAQYNGTAIGQPTSEPLKTAPTHDRFGFVTVNIGSESFYIDDIAMRMLTPRELYSCQGFPPEYVIDRTAAGEPITKTDQVRMVGNSVSPPLAEALVKSNCADLCVIRRRAS